MKSQPQNQICSSLLRSKSVKKLLISKHILWWKQPWRCSLWYWEQSRTGRLMFRSWLPFRTCWG